MKPPVTRLHVVALAASVLLLAGVVAARHFAPQLQRGADSEFSRLRGEQRQLAGHDDPTRDRLREKVKSLPTADAATLAALRSALGSAWRWEDSATASRLRTATLTSDAVAWSAFLSALRTLERQPGIFLREVEFTGASPRPGVTPAHARIAIAWLP